MKSLTVEVPLPGVLIDHTGQQIWWKFDSLDLSDDVASRGCIRIRVNYA